MFSLTINADKFTSLKKNPKFQKASFQVKTICRLKQHWIPVLLIGEDVKEVLFVKEDIQNA